MDNLDSGRYTDKKRIELAKSLIRLVDDYIFEISDSIERTFGT